MVAAAAGAAGGAGASAGGGMSGLASLFQNKLFLQYLSAAGMDIGGGGPLGANVNQATQQNIAAQNYAKLLSTMLSNGGKVTMDKDNINIKGPVSSLASPRENIGLAGPSGSSGFDYQNITPAPTKMGESTKGSSADVLSTLLSMGGGTENPSPSSLGIGEIPASDLAGLTPQDISSALKFKFEKAAMTDQQARDAIDRLYKLSQISQGEAATQIAQSKELRQWEELMRNAPLAVPGLGVLSLDTWEKLPTDVKAYSYYAYTAKERGEEVLSFNEFKQQADPSSLIQYYDLAMKDPEFKKFYFESKKAGATNITIGEKVQQKEALDWVTFRNELNDKMNKYMSSKEVRGKLMEVEPGTPAEKDAMADLKASYIDAEVRNKGEIISATFDEKTGIGTWVVKTRDGRVETVKYALYD